MQVTVGDTDLPLLLDSGAQISVLSEEVMPTIAKTGEWVRVKGYSGESKLRATARVKIGIGGKVLNEVIALASMKQLDGKGLLALNLRNEDAWEILSLLRESGKGVNVVETRAQRKKRVRDALVIERENLLG